MTIASELYRSAAVGAVARVGDEHAFLLAGPPPAQGAESLEGHDARVGPLPVSTGDAFLAELDAADLRGRGGGGFPFARKVGTVRAHASRSAPPIVVVNISESEPASRKDLVLATCRPHLILDGATAAAAAVGADEVVLYVHRASRTMAAALRHALNERTGRRGEPAWRLTAGPDRYVAGEATAVLSHVEGGPALPRWESVPVAINGVHGRPTLVSNAETFAHVALITRVGGATWAGSGPGPRSGPVLLTLQGAVAERGLVVEVVAPAAIGDVLADAGGVVDVPPAVLLGGYAGTWATGGEAWDLHLDPERRPAGAPSLGCGLVAVLPEERCGLAETNRLVRWLATETAGQCGPCVYGLPQLRDRFAAFAAGSMLAGSRSVEAVAADIDGRGGCRHPDGVNRLVRSAMRVFADERLQHRRGRRCRPADGRLLPLAEEP